MLMRTTLTATALAATMVAQGPAFQCSSRVHYSALWQHLHARYDADGDGRISRDEYPRGDVRFANFDRNGDGVLNVTDFPADRQFNAFSPSLARMADADGDNAVSRGEWSTFCDAIDGDSDGEPDRTGLAATLRGWPLDSDKDWNLFLLAFDQDENGRFTAEDLGHLFHDLDADGDGTVAEAEMQRHRRTMQRPDAPLPAVGEPAPDFELPIAGDPANTVSLSSFEGDRPVALLFGSYT